MSLLRSTAHLQKMWASWSHLHPLADLQAQDQMKRIFAHKRRDSDGSDNNLRKNGTGLVIFTPALTT